ncbi:MAG: diaminopimelate epimerase [Rhodobacteraceae bacterium]|jgi:diaminopimelate epimerase|nr:diaminopimelate epimerase [Paracoccaceae bacterium]
MTDAQGPAGLPFAKMHGAGNDFVVIDRRQTAAPVTPALVRALADRHRGVGFDQLALVEPDGEADLRLTFYNADGSESAACGNATRCVARAEMAATGRARLVLRTGRGLLVAEDRGGGLTAVNMGAPLTGWQDIPLARAVDTLRLPLPGEPVATGMGNPHCTFLVDDAEAADPADLGPRWETDALFPARTNVEFAAVTGPDRLRLRIWERGTGVTLASGSCTCAAAVAAARRGLTGRRVRVDCDGGTLTVDWRADGVWLEGPVAHVFDGRLTPAFLAGLA